MSSPVDNTTSPHKGMPKMTSKNPPLVLRCALDRVDGNTQLIATIDDPRATYGRTWEVDLPEETSTLMFQASDFRHHGVAIAVRVRSEFEGESAVTWPHDGNKCTYVAVRPGRLVVELEAPNVNATRKKVKLTVIIRDGGRPDDKRE